MLQASLKSILVGTDLSESSEEVVRSGAVLAATVSAELHVLHALDVDSPPYGLEKEAPIRSIPDQIEYTERKLDEQVRRVVPAGVPLHSRVITAVAHKAIIEQAEDVSADLIVLGPHSGGKVGAHLLGTTADRVIRTAEVPCLVVRRPLSLPFRRTGVPIDFSDPARGALDVAVEWKSRLGMAPGADETALPELSVFHVASPVDRVDNPALPEEVILPRLEQEVKEASQRSGGGAEASAQLDVVWEVNPIVGITLYAREHGLDLLVAGTHGYGGAKRVLIGSVATGIARAAPCSVLLVPPTLSFGIATRREAWEARMRLERVLVAVDFSEPSLQAARWIVHDFAPTVEHRFIHVLDIDVPPAFLGGPTAAREEQLRRTRESADTRLREWARSLVGGESVVIREGRTSREISRVAAELQADVVVVGEHGRRGLHGWLGSTAERLLASSPAPVLLVRSVPPAAPRRILATVDESDLSMGVLLWSQFLSKRFAAPLHVFYALDPVRHGSYYLPGDNPRIGDATEEKAAALEWLTERVRDAGIADDTVRLQIVLGEPGASIIDTAVREQAELIVVGSRGAGTAGRLLLGSVSRVVLRQAPCPVFVVTEPAPALRPER